MAEILGIGATHYPPGLVPEEHKPWPLARMLHTDRRIPERMRDPENWPEPMRLEWGDDEGIRTFFGGCCADVDDAIGGGGDLPFRGWGNVDAPGLAVEDVHAVADLSEAFTVHRNVALAGDEDEPADGLVARALLRALDDHGQLL